MNTHADKTQENKSQSIAKGISQKQNRGESGFQFVDFRPEALTQRKLQKMANNSPQVKQLRAFREMADNSPESQKSPVENNGNSSLNETTQLMAADPNFKKKHTAQSEEEAIEKSKARTGKWKFNSMMDWSIGLYKSAFEFDDTKSGPFNVVSGGWQVSKPGKGKGCKKAKIAKVEGDFTGTATKGTGESGESVGVANHSDGWKNETTKEEKKIP